MRTVTTLSRSLLLIGSFAGLIAFGSSQGGNVRRRAQFSPDERKRLDTFFSNFSEVGLAEFGPRRPSDSFLVRFAEQHEWEQGRVHAARYVLRAARVRELTVRYFGFVPKTWPRLEGYRFDPRAGGYTITYTEEDLIDGDGEAEARCEAFRTVGSRRFAYVWESYDARQSGARPDANATFYVCEVRSASRPSGYILVSRRKITRAEFSRVTGWR